MSFLLLAIAFLSVGCSTATEREEEAKVTDATSLAAKIRRFAPTELTADTSLLSENDRRALDKIVTAAQYMDAIYLRQVWSGNVALLQRLKADASPLGVERLHYFRINMGPWSRLDNNESFMEGVPSEKPPHAGFYPENMSKAEFNEWLKSLSEDEQRRATGYFYVIRRGPDGKLKTVSYSEEYREFLEPAARLLRAAAALATSPTLSRFLKLRADGFASNDYYASDVAWMEVDSPIEVTIGPYETYEDELISYKAAFEAYVTIRDEAESARLARFSSYLQELENNLPVEPRYRNPKLGAAAPIRVVNEVYSSGEGNSGVQTAAYNLPNDERVVKEKGTKRVMLKNVQEAKFQKVLVPISKIVLDPAQQKDLSFDAFFTHILAHELMHGLGPHNIKVGGTDTTVRLQLKELYSAIEEAKADITGLFALQYLIDKGSLDRQMERALHTTFLASAFRSVRFGMNEAHGRGVALQFNYLTDEGAFKLDEASGTFSVDPLRVKDAVRKLTRELLMIEAKGDYGLAREMLGKYAVIRAPMQKAIDRLGSIPVDIEPIFPLAGRLQGGIR
jgi:hypothetical protein